MATACRMRLALRRLLLEKGRAAEIYNIGGFSNKTVVERILAIASRPSSLIE